MDQFFIPLAKMSLETMSDGSIVVSLTINCNRKGIQIHSVQKNAFHTTLTNVELFIAVKIADDLNCVLTCHFQNARKMIYCFFFCVVISELLSLWYGCNSLARLWLRYVFICVLSPSWNILFLFLVEFLIRNYLWITMAVFCKWFQSLD